MDRVIGLIFSNYRPTFQRGITPERPIAAVPFGGRYRLIDFALSNMVNTGLRTVGIITSPRCRPILDHLGGGKEWHLDRKKGGMFILPGSNYGLSRMENKFPLRDIQKNIEILERDYADYVIVSCCNNVVNIDYMPVLNAHKNNGADITLIYKTVQEVPSYEEPVLVLETAFDGRVIDLQKEDYFKGEEGIKIFADMLIINKKTFLEIIKGYETNEYMDLLDAAGENINNLNIFSYEHTGYLGRVYSVYSYFMHSMDMLNPSTRNELFMKKNKILTKIKDNPPTKYASNGSARDALVSSGCIIQGKVEKSILFRAVEE
jgi:glucose-1-phosphate adenylyltransferase